tara:strand:- start:48 stop:221 length:174 start_codon:yes stop_codon:yes gene_type:complete
MSDMKTKIMSRLISGRKLTNEEFFDSLPDVVHSKDIKTKAIWRYDKNHPIYIEDKNK